MSNDDDDVRYCIILLGFIWGARGDFAHFLDGFGLFLLLARVILACSYTYYQ
jgi:hypothetical protein